MNNGVVKVCYSNSSVIQRADIQILNVHGCRKVYQGRFDALKVHTTIDGKSVEILECLPGRIRRFECSLSTSDFLDRRNVKTIFPIPQSTFLFSLSDQAARDKFNETILELWFFVFIIIYNCNFWFFKWGKNDCHVGKKHSSQLYYHGVLHILKQH